MQLSFRKTASVCCLVFCASSILRAESVTSSDELAAFEDYKHITFKDIPPTEYIKNAGVLEAKVTQSASALVRSFKLARQVKHLGFEWKLNGILKIKDAEYEHSKAGDDVPLRIGLMTAGPAPTVPFFAPSWIKSVRDMMKLSSAKMIYFCAGTQSPPGTVWKSPYADSIETRALFSKRSADGWNQVDQAIDPLDVVGVWIMSDGDNTKSEFQMLLRNLRLD